MLRSLGRPGDKPWAFLVPAVPLWGLLQLVWLPPHLRWCRSRSTKIRADTHWLAPSLHLCTFSAVSLLVSLIPGQLVPEYHWQHGNTTSTFQLQEQHSGVSCPWESLGLGRRSRKGLERHQEQLHLTGFLKKRPGLFFFQCVSDTVLLCIFKNLNHLEGVWLKVGVESCLLYGCCWGSTWSVSEIPELFPCLARTTREVSLHSHRISPATDLSLWCFVVSACTFAAGEIVLLCSSDENCTVGKALFSKLIWSSKLPKKQYKRFLYI